MGSSLTYSCQLDRKLFFYFILTLFYPTEELPQENYPPPLARSPSLFRQSRNRDDKILFYPTEELPQENYPPPLSRSPSLFRQSRNRDDKTLFYPTQELLQENYLYALWARYTVVRYTYGAIYTLYAIYFASEMQLKCQRSSEICHFPFPICN